MHGQIPIIWDSAENFNIYDLQGNKFIDFTSAIFLQTSVIQMKEFQMQLRA